MKNTFFTLLIVTAITNIQAQLIATIEMKTPVEGICDNSKVYALFSSFKGQSEAICPVSKEEILKRVNENITFILADKKYKDNCAVNFLINCKGDVVRFEVRNHTNIKELDAHMEAALKSINKWLPGKLHDEFVDSEYTFIFKIKKGLIVFS